MISTKSSPLEVPHEIWGSAFSHITWLENINTTTRVCKLWKEIASPIVKRDFLSEKKQKLHEKMLPFLKMAKNMGMFPQLETWQSLEEYCPVFRTSRKLCNDDLCSVGTFFDQLRKGTQTDKHRVSLGGTCIFAPQFLKTTQNKQSLLKKELGFDSELLEVERHYFENGFKNFIKERGFIILHYSRRKNYDNCYHCKHNEHYLYEFPVEMFNLTIQNGKLIGKKNQGTYCFPLKGKVIELELTPCQGRSIPRVERASDWVERVGDHPSSLATYMPQIHALPMDYKDYLKK